ncbi:hypothetical protein FDG2_1696 [Candidatus Protofrankia californiensis]|uniref:Helix-turn-helix domain-containing protein n=1 Tax=Candidatus Protofrankia californiensis TaxID=1839754 RepID=A0A1C3NW83_9ACTN|nr:hypothetical protein FDG2_1696 [Candidatus Protofrankia californiensis]
MRPDTQSLDSGSSEFLTTAELSSILKIPSGTLRQWRHRGFGPRGFALGSAVRYRRKVVEAWIAEQEAADRSSAA